MGSSSEEAKVHLRVLGRDREVVSHVPSGNAAVTALLPLAREIVAAVTSAAEEDAATRGERASCAKGCAACCRQMVPVSAVEASALVAWIERQPSARQARVRKRFASAITRLEEGGLLDARAPKGRSALAVSASPEGSAWDRAAKAYLALQVACPFLEEEVCGVYADRPMACREYAAITTPAWCGEDTERVRTLPRPVYLGEALAATEAALNGGDGMQIPLVLALEWVKVHGARVQRVHDTEKMFHAFMSRVDTESPERDEHARADAGD